MSIFGSMDPRTFEETTGYVKKLLQDLRYNRMAEVGTQTGKLIDSACSYLNEAEISYREDCERRGQ